MALPFSQDQWVTAGIMLVGITMACAAIPQILRVRHRKSSEDVSLITYGILAFGNLSWLAYGAYRGDWAIMVTNAVALTIAGATIGVILQYR